MEFALSNSVTISKAEHDFLLRSAREYNVLRTALFRGGLTEETLSTLISGEIEYESNPYNSWDENSTWENPQSATAHMAVQSSGLSPEISENTGMGAEEHLPKPRPYHVNHSHSFGQDDPYPETPDERDEPSGLDAGDTQPNSRPPYPRNDQRTVLITSLPTTATHKDLVDVVRGGRLLDIFLRHDRAATVSFVEGAQDFLAYAKRNDIYIHSKRIEARWNDRQFHLPNHVANKISLGATRNIVIRGAVGKLTAEGIREDLEHIHNLVVIDITFKGFDAFISTNSVHNALFARTCMMSRTGYKGLRIEWYPDECAAPVPRPANASWKDSESAPRPNGRVKASTPKAAKITNRFELLNMDGDDTESSSGEDGEMYLSNGVQIASWANTGIMA